MNMVQLGTETIETCMSGCSAKQLWFQSRHLTEIVASGNHGRIPAPPPVSCHRSDRYFDSSSTSTNYIHHIPMALALVAVI